MGQIIFNGRNYSGLIQAINPDCYSTEEREVGCWINGKPLYQKTWEFDSSLTVTSNTWTNSPIRVSDFNFENIVSVIGSNIDGTFFGFLGANHDQTFVQIIQTRNAQITLKNVTFQYTKTTDTAGSGKLNPFAIPTVHYSENEQVIGTWIDGSTLYQKTVPTNDPVPTGATLIERTVQVGYDTIKYTK